MVVEDIEGVLKVVPVPKEDPPEEAAYQFRVAVPFEAVAPKLTLPVPHPVPGVVPETVG